MSIDTHSVRFGDQIIEYDLAFAQRKTLEISVDPQLRVTVTAPAGSDLTAIETKVLKRAPWILRQQRDLELYLPHTPPRRYLSGETHRYLGRQYRLKIIEGDDERVKLLRGFLQVSIIDTEDRSRVKQMVDAWYRKQAQRVFSERLEAMLPRFKTLEVSQPNLVIRRMQSRWGSCTESGTIMLNPVLVQAPKPFIDYVIVHELCHMIEHNHSARFFHLLDRVMPDWRDRRKQLNEFEVA